MSIGHLASPLLVELLHHRGYKPNLQENIWWGMTRISDWSVDYGNLPTDFTIHPTLAAGTGSCPVQRYVPWSLPMCVSPFCWPLKCWSNIGNLVGVFHHNDYEPVYQSQKTAIRMPRLPGQHPINGATSLEQRCILTLNQKSSVTRHQYYSSVLFGTCSLKFNLIKLICCTGLFLLETILSNFNPSCWDKFPTEYVPIMWFQFVQNLVQTYGI